MISFAAFALEDGIPIYLQILTYIKRGILAGNISDGDELPSRRVLSALLGVNPNTVQKAYRMLEDEGLITSHTGAKSIMVLTDCTVARIRTELMENDAKNAIRTLRAMGITMDEAIGLIKTYWNEGEEDR